MKKEKILEICLGMASQLSEEDRALFESCQRYPGIELSGMPCTLSYLINSLKEDIAAESCKETGRSGALNAAKRIIKSAESNQKRRECHGAFEVDGKQCLLDGYQAVRLVTPLPVKSIPEDVEPFNITQVMNTAKNSAGAELALPTIGELKGHIKIEKAANKVKREEYVYYDFGEGRPSVNAEYLLNLLELLPGCKAFAGRRCAESSAIYFESEAGDGILMPCRRK